MVYGSGSKLSSVALEHRTLPVEGGRVENKAPGWHVGPRKP